MSPLSVILNLSLNLFSLQSSSHYLWPGRECGVSLQPAMLTCWGQMYPMTASTVCFPSSPCDEGYKVLCASETLMCWYHTAAKPLDGSLVILGFCHFKFVFLVRETDLRKDLIFSDTGVLELTCSPGTRGSSKLEAVAASMSNWGQLSNQVS